MSGPTPELDALLAQMSEVFAACSPAGSRAVAPRDATAQEPEAGQICGELWHWARERFPER